MRAGFQTGAVRYSVKWQHVVARGALKLYGQFFDEPGFLMSSLYDTIFRRLIDQPSVADAPTDSES
jgi:hypothetical protein